MPWASRAARVLVCLWAAALASTVAFNYAVSRRAGALPPSHPWSGLTLLSLTLGPLGAAFGAGRKQVLSAAAVSLVFASLWCARAAKPRSRVQLNFQSGAAARR